MSGQRCFLKLGKNNTRWWRDRDRVAMEWVSEAWRWSQKERKTDKDRAQAS